MRGIVIVVVLALVGFCVGAEVTEFKRHSYTFTAQFGLYHSQDAARFALVARRQHVPGIRVRVIDGSTFLIEGHGSFQFAPAAVDKVAFQVRKAIDRVPGVRYGEVIGRLSARPNSNPVQTGLIGLLAGLGVGLGITVPRRRRARRMAA